MDFRSFIGDMKTPPITDTESAISIQMLCNRSCEFPTIWVDFCWIFDNIDSCSDVKFRAATMSADSMRVENFHTLCYLDF